MMASRARLGCFVLCFTLTAAVAHSMASPYQQDPFGFEDEVETWWDVLAPQVVDLLLLAGFLALALVGFFRKSVRLRYATLVAAVAYMGFFKSHLISIVDIFAVLGGNLPIFKYNQAFYLLAGFTVVSTVLWGRLYCGRICAFGALTQLMDRLLPARLRLEVPKWLERRAGWTKYGILAAVVAYFLVTRDIGIYPYVEPFWMFTGFGSAPLWVGLAVLLVATIFVRNLYCRFFCPLGATLGLLSKLTVFRIKRWTECNTCKICEKKCEWGAIRGPRIIASECVRCDDCERLYLDRQKCPHWILIGRKAGPVAASPTS
jgi:NosR/NirI family transcriptional regulator, nitrous oxide reductase regulator